MNLQYVTKMNRRVVYSGMPKLRPPTNDTNWSKLLSLIMKQLNTEL